VATISRLDSSLAQRVTGWLSDFESARRPGDLGERTGLFAPESYWGSVFEGAEWDGQQMAWTAGVHCDGEVRGLRPKHIVMRAGGVSGQPHIPTLTGLEAFDGPVCGFENLTADVRSLFGEEVSDRVGVVGGLDPADERHHYCRPTPQPPLWFTFGGIAEGRHKIPTPCCRSKQTFRVLSQASSPVPTWGSVSTKDACASSGVRWGPDSRRL
jgi:hypothetical protein